MVAVPYRGWRIATMVTGSPSGSRSLRSGLMTTVFPAAPVPVSWAAIGDRLLRDGGVGWLGGGVTDAEGETVGPAESDGDNVGATGESVGGGEGNNVGGGEGNSVGTTGESVGAAETGGDSVGAGGGDGDGVAET